MTLQLTMGVPGPMMLFFLTILLPTIWLSLYGWLFYVAFQNLRKWRKERGNLHLKYEILWLLLIAFSYPLITYVQAILQSSYVLATTYADDYVGTVVSAAGYASTYWYAVRFANPFAFLIVMGLVVMKIWLGARRARRG